MARKPDADAIARHVDELTQAPWLPPVCRWWPNFLFHVTDVTNAARILADRQLLSRERATRSGRMVNENAAQRIIGHTNANFQGHARLYFRPITPTFRANEGIRPKTQLWEGAHCPVPIALLFDARRVLGMTESQFTDGGANRKHIPPNVGTTVEFLRAMPWREIYTGNIRDGRLSEEQKNMIRHRQHAEVHVPGALSLTDLRAISFRSIAEKQTLFSLLQQLTDEGPELNDVELRINATQTFVDTWTYVRRVTYASGHVEFAFNAYVETPGPFTLEVRFVDPTDYLPAQSTTVLAFVAQGTHRFPIPDVFRDRRCQVSMRLDSCLAFQGEVDPTAPPSVLI